MKGTGKGFLLKVKGRARAGMFGTIRRVAKISTDSDVHVNVEASSAVSAIILPYYYYLNLPTLTPLSRAMMYRWCKHLTR